MHLKFLKKIINCTNIVGLAGVEQITEAINTKADIIICGRSTDASLIASLPIMKGVDKAIAWHAGKIGECGAFVPQILNQVLSYFLSKKWFLLNQLATTQGNTLYSIRSYGL